MSELLIRHAVLLAVATLLSLLLRNRSASLRHALWTSTLGLLLLLPLLQRVSIPLPQALSQSLPVLGAESEQEKSRANIVGTPVAPIGTASAPQVAAPRPFPWLIVAIGIYAATALVLIARWGVGWALAARLARRATPLGAARGVPVLAAEGVGPLTFGWPKGVILVPHERFALEKLVLRHEVAHVKRADFLWQGIGALACALWWFSPLVWFAARQLRREAERACDDYVLNQGVSAPDYADCLLEVAAMKPLSLPFAASLVQGELAARVTALLAVGKDRRPAAPLAVLGLTALLVPIGLTLTRPVSADVPQAPKVVPMVVAPKPVTRAVRVKTVAPKLLSPAKLVAPNIVAPKLAAPKLATPRVAPPTVAPKPAPVVISPDGIVAAPVPRIVDPVIAPNGLVGPAPKADPTIAPDGRVIAPQPKADPTIAPDGRVAPEPKADPVIAPRIDPTGRVFDPVAPKPAVVAPNGVAPQAVDAVKPPVKVRDNEIIASRSLAGKRIVLDPGHGGTQPGAIYDPNIETDAKGVPILKDLPIIGRLFVGERTMEKDLCYAIAMNAAQRLRAEGAIVTLTRDSDTDPALTKRAELSAGQDLYLSIHIDSGEPRVSVADKNAFRVAVWYHSGAEQASEAKEPSQKLAASIVNTLVLSEFSTQRLNENNRAVLPGYTGIVAPDGKVYGSGFAVLRNAKCPAFLIDLGSMSVRNDVAQLRQSAFQNKLAQGIVEGAKAIL
ncbi:MAG: N-acetylmuramoyl-L-alanine amidase [Armatimonas sp.]